MDKILAFQKDKNRLKLLLLHIAKKKVFLKDYKEYEIKAEDKGKTPARSDVTSGAGGVEFIKQFVSDNKAISAKTICFLPLSSIYIRKVTFPYKRISQIRKSIKFTVEPHIPIPIDNTKIFFRPTHAKNNNLEVMAFILPEEILNEQLELINSAQLVCDEIYLTPLSLLNLFSSYIKTKENALWIDVEEDSTYVFYIFKDGQLLDLREIPVGRKNLIPEKTQLKREISTVLLSQGSESSEDKIAEIYVSGLPDICDWLSESFNIPAKPIQFDNLLSVEQGESSFIPEILYAGCGRNGPFAINFHPPILQEKERRGIRISCSLLIFALLALTFRLQFERNIYESKFKLLNSKIEKKLLETFPETKDTRTPLLQMKSRVKSLKDSIFTSNSSSSGIISPLEALREISQRIDKNLQIELDSFRLKEDNIGISGNASSYQDIDKIKAALENSTLFSSVDIESAQTNDKGVTFRLKIIPARSDQPIVRKTSSIAGELETNAPSK